VLLPRFEDDQIDDALAEGDDAEKSMLDRLDEWNILDLTVGQYKCVHTLRAKCVCVCVWRSTNSAWAHPPAVKCLARSRTRKRTLK
jgi:hypothetical protein